MLSSRDMSVEFHRLSRPARVPAADPAVQPWVDGPPDATRPGALVVALIAAVVVVDQAAKWWAWRHVPWAQMNSGGDALVGSTIGRWYADPVSGALLDLLDFGLLSIAVMLLTRCRRRAFVTSPGALMVGGWGSNLLDRLGIHYLTAPDSVRGAVDFIHLGGQYFNLADFFIIGGTPLFLLAAAYQGVRLAMRRAAAKSVLPRARRRSRVRALVPALAAATLVPVVALGAANYGSVITASCGLTHASTAAAVSLGAC